MSAAPTDHPVAVRLARLSIGAVFLAAALGKIADPAYFARQVHQFHLVPVGAENLIALALPWIELLAALALVMGPRARAGAVVALGLMLVFTAAVGSAWARGLDFRCGCFGKLDAGGVGARKFAENVGLVLIAWVATRGPRGSSLAAGVARGPAAG